MESSIINTFVRSLESKGTIASLMIREANKVVKRIQLIWIIFMKRYTVSFTKPEVFRPVIKLMYILLLEKISNGYLWH